MKKIFILSVFVLLLCVFIGTAQAGQTHIVYDPTNSTYDCRGDVVYDTESTSIQGAVDKMTYIERYSHCDSVCLWDDAGAERAGCYPDINPQDGIMDIKDGETIIVCPGTYTENITLSLSEACQPTFNTTIKSWSGDPNDTIVQADLPSMNVFYVAGPGLDSINVTGLTIQGATDSAPCANSYDDDGNPKISNEDPAQPCAGIRIFCLTDPIINNNIIKGNNRGIIIKDTNPFHYFRSYIENNEIYGNIAGIRLKFGQQNTIQNGNYIHDNYLYGIELDDTNNNVVTDNIIEQNGVRDNGVAINVITSGPYYQVGNNKIYHNSIVNNNTIDNMQVSDTEPYINNWHEPNLLEGNYWSDYNYIIPFGLDDGSGTGKHAIAGDGIGDRYIPHPDADYDNYPMLPARRLYLPTFSFYHPSLQDAYDKALSGIIQSIATIYHENLILERSDKHITLQPGYDRYFQSDSGLTVLKGEVIIRTGSLNINKGALSIR